MIFTEPQPFAEAIESQAVRSVLPTSASSAQLSAIGPELRERAFFSARTTNATYLTRVQGLVDGILTPENALPGQHMDTATARLKMKGMLTEIGSQPSAKDRGTIRDLSSDSRLNLILDTQVKMADGYGYWKQGQDQDILDAFPAQELIREEDRDKPRNWVTKWRNAGGQFYDGRMIALKNDVIWVRISAFGLPYPPFDFNSGMGVIDVDRGEAQDLGVIGENEQVAPQDRKFNEDLEMSAPDRQGSLFTALLQTLGDSAIFSDGVLSLKL